MGGRVGYTITDYSDEKTRHNINLQAVTSANLDGLLTSIGSYQTALDAIVLGVIATEDVHARVDDISNALPASKFAQRETKLLIRYAGNTTGNVYTLTIGTPDLANLTITAGQEFVTLADGGIMAAWVTAFEAIARSPDDDTETVTVLSAQHVGRNI